MAVTIWKPAEYAAGFAETVDGVYAYTVAKNGDYAEKPYNGDTKVCEVARFSGWKQLYYADTGEFEITIPAGQVTPNQIKRNYLVSFEGDTFVIEDFEWSKERGGYECTISGRDMGRYLDDEIIKGFSIGNSVNKWVTEAEGATSVENIMYFMRGFFRQTVASGSAIAWNSPVGWFRDTARCVDGSNFVAYDFADEAATLAEEKGSKYVTDFLSYGAMLRKLVAYFDIGYRWEITPSASGLSTVSFVLYDHGAGNVTMRADGRGISENRYYEKYRGSCNAAHVDAVSAWATPKDMHYRYRTGFEEDLTGWWLDETHTDKNMRFMRYEKDGYSNWAELAADWREQYIDLAECPSENQTTIDDFLAWVKTNSDDYRVPPEIGYSFKYDNSGAYKYGEHFSLGSVITIEDDALGLTVSQRLTSVREKFEGGKAKEFEFEFSDQKIGSRKISQSEMLKQKFLKIARNTYKLRTEGLENG